MYRADRCEAHETRRICIAMHMYAHVYMHIHGYLCVLIPPKASLLADTYCCEYAPHVRNMPACPPFWHRSASQPTDCFGTKILSRFSAGHYNTSPKLLLCQHHLAPTLNDRYARSDETTHDMERRLSFGDLESAGTKR